MPDGFSPAPETDDSLTLDLDGYEGPLHVLLALAKAQKVDLMQISITVLVDQYLAFIAEARKLRLDIAADYLVMAAWLAYLKSKLLLPKTDKAEERAPAEEVAARLAFRLQRLAAMRRASEQLMALPQWGRDVFGRMAAEGVRTETTARYDTTVYDLIAAYGGVRNARARASYKPPKPLVYPLEEARERLSTELTRSPDWRGLYSLTPRERRLPGAPPASSYAASLLSAALELTKAEQACLRQSDRDGVPEVRGI